MEYPPRKIIAMIRAGMREEVLSSNSMWYCLSCYLCTCRCPRGVKPTELAHALESLATQNGYRVSGTSTPAMYNSFVSSIRKYGRVPEFIMMVRYYLSIVPALLAHPLSTIKMLPVGIKLWRHKRLSLMPVKAKGADELTAILRKFREIRGVS